MARQPDLVFAGAPRVNLMPRSEIERRERESLTRKWVWGVLGAVVLTCVVIAAAYAFTLVANIRLASAQAQTNTLLTELAGLSDINSALATQRELTQFRAEAMGADFAWSPVVGAIAGALPPGTSLTGFNVVSGGDPVPGADPKTAVGLSGTYTVASATPLDMAATIRAIRAIPTVIYADGKSVTGGATKGGDYQYQLTVTFNQTIYSGQYAVKAAK
ncbi:hypothetical protein [Microbacterium candidum]|uniref:Fimbrial assembly protein n=1 Tax=Microbacterium candidum TaxID=3041922 RepID=A0ABT7N3V3_9MICO|nr:hypothetical protein [Microbacterium sp. ASV49]MDL9981378.1 hypothetical protein [Microbacterium sp. ASV49]